MTVCLNAGTKTESSGRIRCACGNCEPEHHSEFICACGDGETETQALMVDVRKRLSAGSDELMARPIPESEFVTAIVQSLEWDFDAHITRIYTDQWSMVCAETSDGSFVTDIQCDLVEHGLAATWRAFSDRASQSDAIEGGN